MLTERSGPRCAPSLKGRVALAVVHVAVKIAPAHAWPGGGAADQSLCLAPPSTQLGGKPSQPIGRNTYRELSSSAREQQDQSAQVLGAAPGGRPAPFFLSAGRAAPGGPFSTVRALGQVAPPMRLGKGQKPQFPVRAPGWKQQFLSYAEGQEAAGEGVQRRALMATPFEF
jgi:hypothetical protein